MNFASSVRTRLAVAAAVFTMTSMAHSQTNPWSESYRLEAAGKYAEALAQVEPLGTELAVLRSAYLIALQGKFADAEKRYSKVLDMNSKSIPALVGIMNQQMAQLRYADTITTGMRVLKDNPYDYTAQTNIMFCQWKMSAWADLQKRASDVSPRYPNDVSILVYWARAESALGNKKKARDIYSQVIDLFPGHIEATTFVKAPF
jgi:tetratricopeptide (TPR) repeat protein